MVAKIFIRDLDDEIYAKFKAEAAKRGLKLAEAFSLAINAWLGNTPEAKPFDSRMHEKMLNELTYRKMKRDFLRLYPSKYVVIARGVFQGAFDSLDEAWEWIQHHTEEGEAALVQKIGKERRVARITGSSLRVKIH